MRTTERTIREADNKRDEEEMKDLYIQITKDGKELYFIHFEKVSLWWKVKFAIHLALLIIIGDNVSIKLDGSNVTKTVARKDYKL